MSTATLHYIHDPLCGWCYGAAPLVRVARDTLRVQAHGGGMMAGAARRAVTPELRQFVMAHDRRIAQATGQPFGQAYFEGLLRDTGAVLDSAPPITAILAADELAGAGLDMLARLQKAHYVEGRRIAERAVLEELAAELGLDAEAFGSAYQRLDGAATAAHIERSRALLARVGGQGFPTVALEREGRFTIVDVGPYLGQPDAWRSWLAQQTGGATAAAKDDAPPVCGLDGCAP
ncbi:MULTISPECIES: DsbA family protein [unclassified Rhizobacter]|uniref:DsbA family protein n=1 Tax=unclassified Rhizobacter TaxID=2640088 RepID=UPI0006FD50F2|nr:MULTISPECIES: DsbA family protein [unclassified Rhizobacter]KQU80656.1 protein-disulfide isomerase [Rhizobacter sp. Root29]KQW09666.1 protein-disulfide isomerase [Rhizobacter sp. Root1238]KRB14677.1 protein-disulfide isomerase [Rhizobacter sp. Root16D2]